MRGYKLLLCCEPLIEERSAENPHATFCGNRRRVTASDHPVVWKRGYGKASRAPSNERDGNRQAKPNATAPHLDPTVNCPPTFDKKVSGAGFCSTFGIDPGCVKT